MEATRSLCYLVGSLRWPSWSWIWLLVQRFSSTLGGESPARSCHHWLLFLLCAMPRRRLDHSCLFALGGMLAAVPVAYSLLGPFDLDLREQLRQEPKFVSLVRTTLRKRRCSRMDGWQSVLPAAWRASSLAALAWIWLLVRAFRQHRRWGLGSLYSHRLGLSLPVVIPEEERCRSVVFLVCLAGCCHSGDLYTHRAAGYECA